VLLNDANVLLQDCNIEHQSTNCAIALTNSSMLHINNTRVGQFGSNGPNTYSVYAVNNSSIWNQTSLLQCYGGPGSNIPVYVDYSSTVQSDCLLPYIYDNGFYTWTNEVSSYIPSVIANGSSPYIWSADFGVAAPGQLLWMQERGGNFQSELWASAGMENYYGTKGIVWLDLLQYHKDVASGTITNGGLVWYVTNNTPTATLPNGSIATTTDGRFFVRSNSTWILH
jgi:hypothetical protein